MLKNNELGQKDGAAFRASEVTGGYATMETEGLLLSYRNASFLLIFTLLAGLWPASFGTKTASAQQGGNRLVEKEIYVRIQAGQDTFLDKSSPNQNRNNAERLQAGANLQQHRHSVLEFALPELPPGATLSQAQLIVYNNAEQESDPQKNVFTYNTLTAYRMTQLNWNPNAATWRTYDGTNVWQSEGGDIDTSINMRASFGQAISDSEYTFRRTANIRTLVDDALRNRSRRLLVLVEGQHKSFGPVVEFHSSESSEEQWRPLVRISYQQEELPVSCQSPDAQIDVMVALDHSESMRAFVAGTRTRRLEAAKNAIKNSMLAVFDETNERTADRIRVGLVGFAVQARRYQALTNDFTAYAQSLDRIDIPERANTVIGRGIRLAQDELKAGGGNRSNARKVMIILSDGRERGDLTHPAAAADFARQSGIEVYSIAIGVEGIMPLLYSFPRSAHYYFDRDGSQFDQIFRTIADDVNRQCSEHNLKFCVRDASDPQADPLRKRPVRGARVDVEDQYLRSGLAPPDNEGYLISGNDGCTNPTFLNYPPLVAAAKNNVALFAETSHANFEPKREQWFFQDTFDPQIVIVLLEPLDRRGLKFCVRDSGDGSLLNGARVFPNPPSNNLIREGLEPPDNQGFLITGDDGCTNPDFINYANWQKGQSYTAQAAKDNYQDGSRTWVGRGTGFQVVEIFLAPDTRVDVDAVVSKSAQPDVLVGSNRNTRATITFQVEGVASEGLRNVVIHEKLTTDFRLAADPNFSLSNASIARVERLSNQQADIYVAGGVPVGVYQLSFDIIYSGGFRTGIAIDRFDAAAPDTCDRLANLAHLSYQGTSGSTRCRQIDPGTVEARAPRLILIDDAWIGNKQVTVGDSLQVGRNSVVISGGNVSGSGFIGVDNYTLPSTGRLAWNKLLDLLEQRLDRSPAARTAQTWRCPAGEINGMLYLQGKTSPLDPDMEGGPKVWKLEDCNLRLGNVTFVGTGTITNARGTLHIAGLIAPDPAASDATFGYISLGESGSQGNVALAGSAQVVNMAVFAGNTITIAPNTSVVARKHAVKLIGRTMQFPKADALQADIEIRNTTSMIKNPPPLFEQPFDRPSGREVP